MVDWMSALLGTTDIGKSLQTITELKRQRDIEGTRHIGDYINKYGWTPDLEKQFGQVELNRFLSSRGINLPKTTPLEAFPESPAGTPSLPTEPVQTAPTNQPDTSLLGRFLGLEKPSGRSYVNLPKPTAEQLFEREKSSYFSEPGVAREQVEIASGVKRPRVEQQKYESDINKARFSAIHGLLNEKVFRSLNGETVPTNTDDITDFVDDILAGKKPSIKFEPNMAEQKAYQIKYELSKKYYHLHGKSLLDITPEEKQAITIMSQLGTTKLGSDGKTIQMVEIEKPSIDYKTRPPDKSKPDEAKLNSDEWQITDIVKNGQVVSSIPGKRTAAEGAKPLGEEHIKGIERIAMRHLLPIAYGEWKKNNSDAATMFEFMNSLGKDPMSGQVNFADVSNNLPSNIRTLSEQAIKRSAQIMQAEKIDSVSAYNKAWEEVTSETKAKTKQTLPPKSLTKQESKTKVTYSVEGKGTIDLLPNEVKEFLKKYPGAKKVD